jgi:exonuclease III
MSYTLKSQQLICHYRRELGMEIVQLNCHGLHGKLTEIKLYLYNEKPDVVCLCETWVRVHEPSFVGYYTLWSHRDSALRGGMAILI